MKYTIKTGRELEWEAVECGLGDYLKMALVTTLILGLCALASGHIGKAIDQDFGIYKVNHPAQGAGN